MTCEAVPVMWAVYAVVAGVSLAVVSPKVWHDIAADGIRSRWGVGPGGSATEDKKEGEEP